MNTVLDIKKRNTNIPAKQYSNINNVEDLFNAIEDTLSTNPLATKVEIIKNNFISGIVNVLEREIGFDCWGRSSHWDISFRGYYRWVYFKENKPVFFDDRGCLTDVAPHKSSSFKDKIYETLDFDRFEKIKF